MIIEIHNENTNETGYLVIYYTANGKRQKRMATECFVNSILDLGQKEDFFMGKYRFKIKSDYDKNLILNSKEGERLKSPYES
jgi:hypothetical protein